MTWYYEMNGERLGPIDADTFQSLLLAGTIDADTLVWKAGMTDWAPYRSFQEQGDAPEVPGQERCVECGTFYDPSQMVQYGDEMVCAGCKPVYTQRLIESGHRTTMTSADGTREEMRFAGFWIRVAAFTIDFIALSPVVGPIMYFYIMGVIADETTDIQAILRQQAISFGQGMLMTAVYIAYYIYMHARYEASLGKMALKLKVVRSDGTRISTKLAVGRAFAWELSSMICNIGYIFAAFDNEKRSLHDMICHTRVIYKSAGKDSGPITGEAS